MKIPAGALVVVADGRKALFLENRGDEDYPNLQLKKEMAASEGASDGELAADRPGRTFESVGSHRHALDNGNLHDLAEAAFAREVANALKGETAGKKGAKIILVAPPRTMAVLRPALAKLPAGALIGELTKDLTGHPMGEIEKIVAAA